MVKNLLEKTLKDLGFKINAEKEINLVKYNKDIFAKLFDKFNYFKMEEVYYNGVENRCWVEVIEEGVWDLSLESVKMNILENIKYAKKYLYNTRKYGWDRLWIYKTKDESYVFIYLRDILGVYYHIWFTLI